jgi:predicted enzyme related to lactoylglutathione lyase
MSTGRRPGLPSIATTTGGGMGELSRLYVGMYTFDCRDAARLAGFWSGVLEHPVDDGATADLATIGLAEDGPTWLFSRADDLATGRNRLMLDLGGEEDWREHADRVEALGGTRIGDHELRGARWSEFRDPEGNTFRIFGPRPT